MIKVFFVLVMSVYHGGITTGPQFTTMQQCEAAKALVQAETERVNGRNTFAGNCIEVQVPARKLKCKIGNNFSYTNAITGNSNAKNMNGYPYPETVECVEE